MTFWRTVTTAAALVVLPVAACGDTDAPTSSGVPGQLTVLADVHHTGVYTEGALTLTTITDADGNTAYDGATEHLAGWLREGTDRSYPLVQTLELPEGPTSVAMEIRACTLGCPPLAEASSLRSDGATHV